MSLTLLLEKYDVSTDEGLQKALNEIEKEETDVNDALANALSRACNLEGRLRAASQGYTKLGEVKRDAEVAAHMVEKTASLARDVSAKVRQLDLARSRVAECQRRVHDLIDLRVCSAGVEQAIKAHDYETAAGYVARFLSMEPGSVEAASARGLDPRADMTRAAATLREHLVRKFSEAAKKEDEEAVERLFKLFPQIGSADEGTDLLAQYLAAQLEARLRRLSREGGAAADVLTRALEAAGAAVERARRLLPAPAALPRALAHLQPVVCAGAARVCGTALRTAGAGAGPTGAGEVGEAGAAELALLLSRLHLYLTFLRRRPEHMAELDEAGRAACAADIEHIIAGCELTRTAQDVLNHYLTLERDFLEESVSKAIKMSTPQPGSTTSNLVDDVFYITRKVIRRAISTGSVEAACVALNEASAQLERCASALRRRLTAPPPAPLPLPGPRAVPPAPGSADLLYIAHTCEAEAGAEWAERLAGEAVRGASALCRGDAERDKLVSCAGALGAAAAAFRAAHEMALAAVRGALQPALAQWAEVLAAADGAEDDAGDAAGALDVLATAAREQLPTAADQLLVWAVGDLVARTEKAILRNSYDREAALGVERRARRLAAWAGAEAGGARERCGALCGAAAVLAAERPAHAVDAAARLPPHAVRDLLARRTDFKMEDIRRLKL